MALLDTPLARRAQRHDRRQGRRGFGDGRPRTVEVQTQAATSAEAQAGSPTA